MEESQRKQKTIQQLIDLQIQDLNTYLNFFELTDSISLKRKLALYCKERKNEIMRLTNKLTPIQEGR